MSMEASRHILVQVAGSKTSMYTAIPSSFKETAPPQELYSAQSSGLSQPGSRWFAAQFIVFFKVLGTLGQAQNIKR